MTYVQWVIPQTLVALNPRALVALNPRTLVGLNPRTLVGLRFFVAKLFDRLSKGIREAPTKAVMNELAKESGDAPDAAYGGCTGLGLQWWMKDVMCITLSLADDYRLVQISSNQGFQVQPPHSVAHHFMIYTLLFPYRCPIC